MDWLSIAGGLVVLTIGAELLIRGSTALAKQLGVSDLLIGLTLVGFGTSTPELVSSVQAALIGSPGVAVGNVVGSNIANILFILGLSVLIAPFAVEPEIVRPRRSPSSWSRRSPCIGVSMTESFSRPAGLCFIAAIVGYILYAFYSERAHPDSPKAEQHAAAGARSAGGAEVACCRSSRWRSSASLSSSSARSFSSPAPSMSRARLGVSEDAHRPHHRRDRHVPAGTRHLAHRGRSREIRARARQCRRVEHL